MREEWDSEWQLGKEENLKVEMKQAASLSTRHAIHNKSTTNTNRKKNNFLRWASFF